MEIDNSPDIQSKIESTFRAKISHAVRSQSTKDFMREKGYSEEFIQGYCAGLMRAEKLFTNIKDELKGKSL